MPVRRLRVGISSCLLGRKVRYDAQHERDPFLVDGVAYLRGQVYLDPDPEELKLRNHV